KRRKWVQPSGPLLLWRGGFIGPLGIFTVIKYHLKKPLVGWGCRCARQQRNRIAIKGPVGILLGKTDGTCFFDPMVFRRCLCIHIVCIFALVPIPYRISLAVILFFEQPRKNLFTLYGVGHLSMLQPVYRYHATACQGTPVYGLVVFSDPFFEPDKRLLCLRAVIINPVFSRFRGFLYPSSTRLYHYRNERTTASECIAVCPVVFREPFFGINRDKGDTRKRPTDPECRIPRSGAVDQAQARTEIRSSCGQRNFHASRYTTIRGVYIKLMFQLEVLNIDLFEIHNRSGVY